ncbi:MAG: hypothetical protein ACYDBB_02305 [Armatimonadota bacterium]
MKHALPLTRVVCHPLCVLLLFSLLILLAGGRAVAAMPVMTNAYPANGADHPFQAGCDIGYAGAHFTDADGDLARANITCTVTGPGNTAETVYLGIESGNAQTGFTIEWFWYITGIGDYTVTLDATDSATPANHASYTATIHVTNQAPVITQWSCTNITSATTGNPVNFQAQATDANGNLSTCTYAITPPNGVTAPTMFSYPMGDGSAKYDIPFFYATAPGTYNVTCTATDTLGASTTSTALSVTVVNPPPTVTVGLMTTPPYNAFLTGMHWMFSVSASDTNGAVHQVRYTVLPGTPAAPTDINQYAIAAITPLDLPSVGGGIDWEVPSPAATYTVFVKAQDNEGLWSEAVSQTFTTINPAPTASISMPTSGASLPVSMPLPLNAQAWDINGSIDQVRYVIKPSTDPEPANPNVDATPYTGILTWNGMEYATFWTPVVGNHVLYVVAEDNEGLWSSLASVAFSVINLPPTISVTMPMPGFTHCALPLQAMVWDMDDPTITVTFTIRDAANELVATLTPTKNVDTYAAEWTPLAVGDFTFTVTADDGHHTPASQQSVAVHVTNTPPTVYLTQPSSNPYPYPTHLPITIEAIINDWNGGLDPTFFPTCVVTCAGVTVTPSPVYVNKNNDIYTWSWTPVVDGEYTITVTARDVDLATTAMPVTIQVENPRPSVWLMQPTGGTVESYTAIAIEAGASDDETVTGVTFYAVDYSVQPARQVTWPCTLDTQSNTWKATWSAETVLPAVYSIYAIATDNDGATTTSPAMSLMVANPQLSIMMSTGVIGVNRDHDNGDEEKADLTDTVGPIAYPTPEDDLQYAGIQFDMLSPSAGTVMLSLSAGNNITIWDESVKAPTASLGQWNANILPKIVWLEGMSASALRTVTLTAEYINPACSNQGHVVSTASVQLSVVQVTFTADDTAYVGLGHNLTLAPILPTGTSPADTQEILSNLSYLVDGMPGVLVSKDPQTNELHLTGVMPGSYRVLAKWGYVTVGWVTVYVVDVNLMMPDTMESTEEDPGSLMVVNTTAQMYMMLMPPFLPGGKLSLTVSGQTSAVNLSYQDGANTLPVPDHWDINPTVNLPICIDVAAVEYTPRQGVTLTLTYTDPNDNEIIVDTVKITIMQVNVEMQKLDETNEETPGALIPVNDDDDDRNGMLDMAQTGVMVNGEDDLHPVTLTIDPADMVGTATLTAYGNIAVWQEMTKEHRLYPPEAGNPPITTWTLDGTIPFTKTVYVEGLAASDYVRDARVSLSYLRQNMPIATDSVAITVVKASLSLQDLSGSDKMNVGAILALNKNNNTSNLVPVTLSLQPANLDFGTVTLTSSSGLKLWTTAAKGAAAPSSWTLAPGSPVPSTPLYVEGVTVSKSINSDSLKLNYSWNGVTLQTDAVNATVVDLILALNSSVLYVNNDDDDTNGDSDLTQDGPITSENDLEQLRITMSPAGLTGVLSASARTVQYGEPDQNGHRPITGYGTSKLNFYLDSSKGTSAPTGLNWSFDAGTSAPDAVWLEGTGLSAITGDQEITFSFAKDSFTVSSTVTATVNARSSNGNGDNEVTFKLYSQNPIGQDKAVLNDEISGDIGGNVYVIMEVKVAPGMRLSSSNATVRIKDNWSGYVDGETRAWIDVTVDFSGTDWSEMVNQPDPNSTCDLTWSSVAPYGTDNAAGAFPRTFYKVLRIWNTATEPYTEYYKQSSGSWIYFADPTVGHNGEHSIKIIAVGGDTAKTTLDYQQYDALAQPPGWQSPTQVSVDERKATVSNLLVTNLSPGNGTIDYIKYDPVPDSKYHRPTMIATFTDKNPNGQQHTYVSYWMLLVTASSVPREHLDMNDVYSRADAVLNSDATTNSVNFTWEGHVGEIDVNNPPANTQYDEANWGTYTYDVDVIEYDENGAMVDWHSYKWPSCLSIGTHTVTAVDNADGSGSTLSYTYVAHDIANEDTTGYYPNAQNPSSLQVVVMDNVLEEQGTINLNAQIDGQTRGGVAATSSESAQYFEWWRTMYVGQDNCWIADRRDHVSSRMLAINIANAAPDELLIYVKVDPKKIVDGLKAVLGGPVAALKFLLTADVKDGARIGVVTPNGEYWYHFMPSETHLRIGIPPWYTIPERIKRVSSPKAAPFVDGLVLSYRFAINGNQCKASLDNWLTTQKTYDTYTYNSVAWVANALDSLNLDTMQDDRKDHLIEFYGSRNNAPTTDPTDLMYMLIGGGGGVRAPDAFGVFAESGIGDFWPKYYITKQGVQIVPPTPKHIDDLPR